MTKCQIKCKSLQTNSKRQNFLRVWHLVTFRAEQLKITPCMLTSWPLTWFPLCGELIKRRYDTWITDFLQLLVADTFFWWSILLASLRTLFAQSLVSKVLVGSWWVVNIIPLLDVDLKRKTFLARCMVPSIAWYPCNISSYWYVHQRAYSQGVNVSQSRHDMEDLANDIQSS